MPDERDKLKLGKGSAFVKRDLRQLPQTKDVWEADFLPLPPIGETEWQGFQVRALDAGGLIYDDTECNSFAGAMQSLETGLGAWFMEQDR